LRSEQIQEALDAKPGSLIDPYDNHHWKLEEDDLLANLDIKRARIYEVEQPSRRGKQKATQGPAKKDMKGSTVKEKVAAGKTNLAKKGESKVANKVKPKMQAMVGDNDDVDDAVEAQQHLDAAVHFYSCCTATGSSPHGIWHLVIYSEQSILQHRRLLLSSVVQDNLVALHPHRLCLLNHPNPLQAHQQHGRHHMRDRYHLIAMTVTVHSGRTGSIRDIIMIQHTSRRCSTCVPRANCLIFRMTISRVMTMMIMIVVLTR
jgi:hypothetical protein